MPNTHFLPPAFCAAIFASSSCCFTNAMCAFSSALSIFNCCSTS